MGKRLVNAYKNLDKNQAYSLKDAIKIVKEINSHQKVDDFKLLTIVFIIQIIQVATRHRNNKHKK